MEKLSTSIWVYLPAREKGHTGSLHGRSPDVKLTERDEQCKGIYERGKDQKQATAEPAKTIGISVMLVALFANVHVLSEHSYSFIGKHHYNRVARS